MSAKAVVLIEAERAAMLTLGRDLAALDGVSEVYGVTGEWDFVAIVDVVDAKQLGEAVARGVQALDGIARTHTLVVLDAYHGGGEAA
ncbi:MAG: Lrp/AsnC ligand binding domain-containing protein [Patulibacter sp.]